MTDQVLVVGGGSVGLVAATLMAKAGVPVVVLEAERDLPVNLRASTFHPPTLDMLHELGVANLMIAQGLRAPVTQYRSHREGLIANFNFGLLSGESQHPFRLQCEQYKLNRILLEQLKKFPHVEVVFGCRGVSVEQRKNTVTVFVECGAKTSKFVGRYLVGADGAGSAIRKTLGIEFEGFTWPERFLVVSTPVDFKSYIPDLESVSYVADPQEWYLLLQVPGFWRVLLPTSPEEADEAVLSDESLQRRLKRVYNLGTSYPIGHKTLFRVHQRVAKSYRSGRSFLAGDAAHVNNPLGGMGLNGGIHDAFNLASKLVQVMNGEHEDLLDQYDSERRPIALEYINKHTIQNKRNLETDETEFRESLRDAASNPEKALAHIKRTSMFASAGAGRDRGGSANPGGVGSGLSA